MTQSSATDGVESRRPGAAGAGGVRAAVVAGGLIAVVFAAAALVVMVLRPEAGRGAFDEINYHEPAIRVFTEQWPRVDVSDYLSATTPGYHLLMAALLKALGPDERVMRVANLLIGCTLVGGLAWACARRAERDGGSAWGGGGVGMLAALPMAASMYVLSSGVWLLPDNLGWLLVLAVLLIALEVSRGGALGRVVALVVLGGAVLAALVMVRQIHIWSAAALWAGAWLSVGAGRDGVFSDSPRQAARVALGVAAAAPAFVVVALFVRMWGGLTPPTFQGQYHDLNPAAPAFILALVGLASIFFAPVLAPSLAALWRERAWVVVVCAGAGLAAATLVPTTYSFANGRWTGVWNISLVLERQGVVVWDRSPLIAGLSAIGAVALAGWVRRVGTREGLVLLGALAAFTAAQAASFQLWQRYSEPLVLMLVALLATGGSGRAAEAGRSAPGGWRRAAPMAGAAVLAGLLGAQSAVTFARAEPAAYYGFIAGGERVKGYLVGETPEPVERPRRP